MGSSVGIADGAMAHGTCASQFFKLQTPDLELDYKAPYCRRRLAHCGVVLLAIGILAGLGNNPVQVFVT
jgi:hypothetical protein